MTFPASVTALATVAALAACGPYVKTTIATPDATTTVEKVGARTKSTTVVTPVPGTGARSAVQWAGTYAGTLPCADCPGILTDLTVRADSSFTLKEHYLESGTAPMEQTGKWRMTNDMLVIGGTDGQAWNFRPTDGGLQLVDASGNAHTSELDYTLDKVAGQ